MGREVEVKGVNMVGADMEVVVALLLGVITKVKVVDCPVE